MSYTTGLAAVKAALDAQANYSSGNWISELWWDGKKSPVENRQFVRFVTDDVISIPIHEYVPTLTGKKYDFICARELAEPRDCVICSTFTTQNDAGETIPAKPRTLTFGLVVIRKEEHETVNGRLVPVYTDSMVEVEDNNKVKKMVKDYRIIKQSQKTFWNNLHGYFARYGTIIDRDYEISRSGNTGQNTTYTILPCDPIEGFRTPEEISARYNDSPQSIVEYIEYLGSKSRYDKFLISGTKVSSPQNGESQVASGAPESSDKGSPGVTTNDTTFGSLREKLMSYSTQKS